MMTSMRGARVQRVKDSVVVGVGQITIPRHKAVAIESLTDLEGAVGKRNTAIIILECIHIHLSSTKQS